MPVVIAAVDNVCVLTFVIMLFKVVEAFCVYVQR